MSAPNHPRRFDVIFLLMLIAVLLAVGSSVTLRMAVGNTPAKPNNPLFPPLHARPTLPHN